MRSVTVEKVEEYDKFDDAVTLKVDGRFIRILLPKDRPSMAWILSSKPGREPFGLNLVYEGHYT